MSVYEVHSNFHAHEVNNNLQVNNNLHICRRQGGLKGRGQRHVRHVLTLSTLSGLSNGRRSTQFHTWCGRGQKPARGQIFPRAALVVARCGIPRTEMGHFRWAGLPRRGTTCRCVSVCVCARAHACVSKRVRTL